MDDLQRLTVPVARQVLLQSFSLSQGDPRLQHYLLRYAATCRPHWRLDEESSTALLQLTPTIHALAARGVHSSFTRPREVEHELEKTVELMRTEFERPRGDRSELLISIIRSTVFRDWRFLCDCKGRPRPPRSSPVSPRRDAFLSFFCHYILLGHRTGVAVFDELLMAMREAVESRSAIYQTAMDCPSAELCLGQVIVIHNENHPEQQVPCIVSPEGFAQHVEPEVMV